ncbi:protein kinase, partial [Mycobacterium numidiamassiliense]
ALQAPPSNRRLVLAIVGGSVFALVAVVALVIALISRSDGHSGTGSASSSAPLHPRTLKPGVPLPTAGANPTGAAVPPLPAFAPPADLGANCQYPTVSADSQDASPKPVTLPPTGKVSTTPPVINATIATNFGDIGIQLANAESPCAVNSFVSLARQQFFNNTECSRLTTTPGMGTLTCGGPNSDGTGGPGYEFADEYPVNQYSPSDPALRATVLYPRGTLALATSEPNTNGSQFVIFTTDAESPPVNTVFGSVDQAGLTVVDKIVAAGVAGNRDSGMPTNPVTITSVQIG